MSLNKSTVLQTFNSTFFDFINDIISIFPDNSDIVTAKNFFEMTKKANPTIIIKIWFIYIYKPYSSVIEQGDISFFYDKNYEGDLANLVNSKEILKTIDTLRDPIRSMSETNKSHSMKYIQLLSNLSEVYNKLTA